MLDVQAELLSHLDTRVVVTLLPEATAPPPISELNPIFEVKGARHVMVTQALSALPNRKLGRAIASFSTKHDAITKALDLLLVGF